MTTIHLRHGDCVEVLKGMKEGSVGGIVCDPPYGLEFMGAKWDNIGDVRKANRGTLTNMINADGKPKFQTKAPAFDLSLSSQMAMQGWHVRWLSECYRALAPGGIIKAFSGSRTAHRLAAAFDDAGFVDVSLEAWNYGSGFPKSMDVSKAIDKAAGAEREAVGVRQLTGYGRANVVHGQQTRNTTEFVQTSDVPASDAAKRWDGWGTALKPAWEPVIVGRKP